MNVKTNITLISALILAIMLVSGCTETTTTVKTTETTQTVTETTVEKTTQTTVQTPPPAKVTEEPQENTGPAPTIEFSKTAYDFGEVGPSKPYIAKYPFKNTGKGVLNVGRLESTCSCSIPKLEKTEYLPGESGEITVNFASPKRAGKTQKYLYVNSNDPKNPRVRISIKAEVINDIDLTPDNLKLSLIEENAGIKPITIKSKSGKKFSIKSIASTKNTFAVEFNPELKQDHFTLTPKVNLERLQKSPKGAITIDITHPQIKQLFVKYNAPSLYSLSKQKVIIQKPGENQPVLKTIIVKSNYGKKVEIDTIASDNNTMKVLKKEKQGDGVKLQVQITPPPKSDKRYFKDILRIKTKDHQELTVFCSGWY